MKANWVARMPATLSRSHTELPQHTKGGRRSTCTKASPQGRLARVTGFGVQERNAIAFGLIARGSMSIMFTSTLRAAQAIDERLLSRSLRWQFSPRS